MYVFSKLTKDMEMTKAQLENERKIQQLQMQAINALWKKFSSMQHTTSTNTSTTIDSQNMENTSSTTSTQNTLSLDNSSTTVVNDLAKTCTMLTNQVQQWQGSMRDILNCLTLFCNLPQENAKRLLTAGVAEALSTNNAGHAANSTSSSNTITSFVDKRDSAATQTEIVAVHTPQLERQSNFPFSKIRPSTLLLIESQNPGTPSHCNSSTLASNVTSTTTNADTENMITTPTKKTPLEESGIASADDVRSSNDSVSIVEKQDEGEKHTLNLTTTISG